MRTIVVSGGTSGIGQGLTHALLDRGDQVVVVGPDPAKGRELLAAAQATGAGDRAVFLRADLSLVSENQRVVEELRTRFVRVDALVLCARYFRSSRVVTREGFEHNFALYYLSRFLLGHGLAGLLEKAERPVVLNIAGPGVTTGNIQWDDLGFEQGYDGWSAMFQGGKLNDLLGVSFADRGHRARYVLLFPGGTRTGFAGEFDVVSAAQVARMKLFAQPVEAAIPPIMEIIDSPPADPLSAFVEGTRMSVTHPSFDQGDAVRLDALTWELLAPRSGDA